MQSKLESLIEANVNTWLGFGGSLLITLCVFAFVNELGLWWASMLNTVLCTVWSLLRGYYIRRFFNARHMRSALQYTHGISTHPPRK